MQLAIKELFVISCVFRYTYRAFRAIANIINLQYNVKPISCTLIVIFSEMCMDTTNGLFYVSTIKL